MRMRLCRSESRDDDDRIIIIGGNQCRSELRVIDTVGEKKKTQRHN